MHRIQLAFAMQLVGLTLLLIPSPETMAGVFKCTDPDGNTTYQSRPCTSDTTQSEIKLRTHPGNYSGGNSQSAQGNKTAVDAVPSVVLYSTEWCGYCKKIRKLFADNNIAYEEHDIEKSATAKRQYDKLKGKGVPLTTIDGTLVRGYKRDRLLALARPN